MSYQFAHLNVYSRKADKTGVNTDFVFGEVMRVAGCCDHVEHPQPPVLVYGMDVPALKTLHDGMAGVATSTNAKGQRRGIRKDQKTLATIILSHPGDQPGIAPVGEWQERSIRWLKDKYGDDLKTVVRHDDEAHPHLHAYLLPQDAEMRAASFHPGMKAKAAVTRRGASIEENRAGDKAYRQAMREWQDDYHQAVGVPCGLLRIGPSRRRLSRADYMNEKQQAQRVREAQAYASGVDDIRTDIEQEREINTQDAKFNAKIREKNKTDRAEIERLESSYNERETYALAKRLAEENQVFDQMEHALYASICDQHERARKTKADKDYAMLAGSCEAVRMTRIKTGVGATRLWEAVLSIIKQVRQETPDKFRMFFGFSVKKKQPEQEKPPQVQEKTAPVQEANPPREEVKPDEVRRKSPSMGM